MTDQRQTADPEICAHWDWCPYCKNGLDTGLQCDQCLADLMPVQEALRELQRLRDPQSHLSLAARQRLESSSAGARDEDDAPELTADDFKRPSAKWNAPEPSESRTTSLLLSQAARLLREYADDAHAEDVPDVLRWLAVYEGRSTEPAGGHGNPCPLCKAHNLASCECPQEDHVDSVKVQPAFYRIQHKFDKGRFNDFSTDMWDLIIPGLPLTKEAKP